MGEDREVIETTAFESRSVLRAQPQCAYRARRTQAPEPAKRPFGGAYLMIRLGICALALIGILYIKLSGNSEALAVVADLTTDDTDAEERLGRLKFVELPSIIDVFAPSDKAILPEAASLRIVNDGFDIELETSVGEAVKAPISGKAADVGEDAELGAYVSVSNDDDITITVYGLGDDLPERGQPIKQGNVLGSASEGKLTIRVSRAGRPVSAAEYFGL